MGSQWSAIPSQEVLPPPSTPSLAMGFMISMRWTLDGLSSAGGGSRRTARVYSQISQSVSGQALGVMQTPTPSCESMGGWTQNGPTSVVEGFCHVDDLSPLSPDAGLFSANIYLKMPIAGGDLEIWPIEIRSR